MPNSVTNLISDVLYSSGMWLDLAPRTDTKKTCVKKEIGLRAQNMITILSSIVNLIGGTSLTMH